MAYNLQSLITILQQALDPDQTHYLHRTNKRQLQSLLKKATSLQQILDKSPLPITETLEIQIRTAALKAEDIIESYMVDQMLDSSVLKWLITWCQCFTFCTPHLHQVMQELDSAMAKLVEAKSVSSGTASSSTASSSRAFSVGVVKDLDQLKDRLTGMQRKLEIVPIVGMGGIGKTTLARKIYEDSLIVSHFTCLAWATFSQDYNMRAILVSLLHYILGKDQLEKHIDKEDAMLKDILYKRLYGRRYMIVLDDIWSKQAWDEIRRYFPDNNNGSRIVITTRESDVASHTGSVSLHHRVQLLSEPESWSLLRKIVFGNEDCPDILHGIGEKIASSCGGLPLAISVIGGILSNLERSTSVWENLGKDVRDAIAKSDTEFSHILSLSYNHLLYHLKACFLYMGAFPEDHVIKGSRLVRLWVAEGFVKSNEDRSLEEVAEDYLKGLLERNLLIVTRNKANGKPSSYIMHDLLRDLCMRKAEEEKFLCVERSTHEAPSSNLRRLSIQSSSGMGNVQHASVELRSILCTTRVRHENPPPFFSRTRLLRVLDVKETLFQEFPIEVLHLVNLRYLAIACRSCLPRGISRLVKLQTLIAEVGLGKHRVPFEVLELSELRHLKMNGEIWFEDEPLKRFLLKKLQTISLLGINRSLMRVGMLESIPNIKKLDAAFDSYRDDDVDLSRLHKLETLSVQCHHGMYGYTSLPSMLRFPSGLRKLSLYRCGLYPSFLKMFCALPNLEVLKISWCTFSGGEWEVGEGDQFCSLQYLSLRYVNLRHLKADETSFPRLEHLHVKRCDKLEEIPGGVGDIPALRLIELDHCKASLVASARQIQEEQQSEYENYDLQLHIT